MVPRVGLVDELWKEYKSNAKNLKYVSYPKYSLAEQALLESSTGERPTHRIGWGGCFGRKVDSIDFYRGEMEELRIAIEGTTDSLILLCLWCLKQDLIP